jgi:hypothetical protein
MSEPVFALDPGRLVIPIGMLLALVLAYALSRKRPGFTLAKFGISGAIATAVTLLILPCFAMTLFMIAMIGQFKIPNVIAGAEGTGMILLAAVGVLAGIVFFLSIYLTIYAGLERLKKE